jgi:hypothetical protein
VAVRPRPPPRFASPGSSTGSSGALLRRRLRVRVPPRGLHAPLAQLVELPPFKRRVRGSSPRRRTAGQTRSCSGGSVGRAPPRQDGGRWFESSPEHAKDTTLGAVDEQVESPGFHPGSCGFESRPRCVTHDPTSPNWQGSGLLSRTGDGSSPSVGAVPWRSRLVTDTPLETAYTLVGCRGFESHLLRACVAQRQELRFYTPAVPGSSPGAGTILFTRDFPVCSGETGFWWL